MLPIVELPKLTSSSSLVILRMSFSPVPNLPVVSYFRRRYVAMAMDSDITVPSPVSRRGALPRGWIFLSSGGAILGVL